MPRHELSRSKKKRKPAVSPPRCYDEESEDIISHYSLSTDTDDEYDVSSDPIARYLHFLHYEYDGDPTKIPPSQFAGPLLANELPAVAWDKWCKDGVVCFGLNALDMLKFYLANPMDLSVYHVVDFYFPKFGLKPFVNMNMVGYTLLGSKIYVMGGIYDEQRGPLEAHYCDLANQSQLPGGGYEWMALPKLNARKPNPLVFSLAGNIYVLSMLDIWPDQPFEVLKPGKNNWEVLRSPFTPNCKPIIRGSFIVEDKKILIHSAYHITRLIPTGDEFLYIYDAERDDWTQLKFQLGPDPKLSNKLSEIFSVKDMGLLLDRSDVFVLDSLYKQFERSVVKPILGLDLDSIGGQKKKAESWHIVNLGRGTRKFCMLAFYIDGGPGGEEITYVKFGTFDLVQHKKSKGKRLKLSGYKVGNENFKTIHIADCLVMGSGGACRKVGGFSNY